MFALIIIIDTRVPQTHRVLGWSTAVGYLGYCRDATTAKTLRGTKVWAKDRAGCWVRERVAPPAVRVRGYHRRKKFVNSDTKFYVLMTTRCEISCFFENYGQEVGGPLNTSYQPRSWETSLPRSLRLLRLWDILRRGKRERSSFFPCHFFLFSSLLLPILFLSPSLPVPSHSADIFPPFLPLIPGLFTLFRRKAPLNPVRGLGSTVHASSPSGSGAEPRPQRHFCGKLSPWTVRDVCCRLREGGAVTDWPPFRDRDASSPY